MIIEGNFCDINGEKRRKIEVKNGLISRLNAEGKSNFKFDDTHMIFPGFIDLHVHARQDNSGEWNYKETFYTASMAALNGGVIAFLDQPNTPRPAADPGTLRAKQKLASKTPIDICLNAGIGPKTFPITGHNFYKLFTTKSVEGIYFTDYRNIEDKLKEYVQYIDDLHLCVHCEDHKMIELKGRTASSEVMAIVRMIEIGEKLKIPHMHIYHVSTKEGMEVIEAGKEHYKGLTCSVTPHHLFFDKENVNHYLQNENIFMYPPLKKPDDKEYLMDALKKGAIDYLATDHAPHTLKDKRKGVSGVPQLDTFGMFTMWLCDKEVKPERIAEICSYNPAKFLGRKIGKIKQGYEASFTVLKNDYTEVTKKTLKTKCGWSPFESVFFPGRADAVFIKGIAFIV